MLTTGRPRALGLIPARGGSKGLPGKNLAKLGGHPLIAWSIRSALESRALNRVAVSSEDSEILKVSGSYGAETILRPSEYATDEASSDSVILHALEVYPDTEVLVFLQPTSPFRRSSQVDAALRQFVTSDSELVVSVTRAREHAELLVKVESAGTVQAVMTGEVPQRRQGFTPTYRLNGAIYIVAPAAMCIAKSVARLRPTAFEMDEVSSMDVDTPEDLNECERLLKSGLVSNPWEISHETQSSPTN